MRTAWMNLQRVRDSCTLSFNSSDNPDTERCWKSNKRSVLLRLQCVDISFSRPQKQIYPLSMYTSLVLLRPGWKTDGHLDCFVPFDRLLPTPPPPHTKLTAGTTARSTGACTQRGPTPGNLLILCVANLNGFYGSISWRQ